jgi:hypothetical protein
MSQNEVFSREKNRMFWTLPPNHQRREAFAVKRCKNTTPVRFALSVRLLPYGSSRNADSIFMTFQFRLKSNNNGQFTVRRACTSAQILNETYKVFIGMKKVYEIL